MEEKKILIKWNSTYELGIKEIDRQHMKLVDIINDFYNAFATAQAHEKIGDIIEDLVNYTVFHFTAEEEIFSNSDYPETTAHKTKHKEFVEELKRYHQEVKDGNMTTTYDLMTYLRDWLIKHIMGTDRGYLDYIKK
ncbi:MAG: hemerythrin family protein [Chlorobi bacterium]|nr:hemerythrin family protein [Chlorobiota bacterium]